MWVCCTTPVQAAECPKVLASPRTYMINTRQTLARHALHGLNLCSTVTLTPAARLPPPTQPSSRCHRPPLTQDTATKTTVTTCNQRGYELRSTVLSEGEREAHFQATESRRQSGVLRDNWWKVEGGTAAGAAPEFNSRYKQTENK